MNDIAIFWTAVGAAGAIGASMGGIVAALVGWRQLRQLSKSAGIEALLKLYSLFDKGSNRKNRKIIWRSLQSKAPDALTDKEWNIIETTATQMDVIGTVLKFKQVKPDLVFERYAEVIIPLWDAINPHIATIRKKKGGYGWSNFEWMVQEAKKWNAKKRNSNSYSRFEVYDGFSQEIASK